MFCAITQQMDKKDIYEHLANIYLDASSSKKNKKKIRKPSGIKNLSLIGLALVLMLSFFFVAKTHYSRKPLRDTQVALVLYPDVLKINFDFDPAKKEICSINLNGLNLTRYNALGFSIKKDDPKNNVSLRVELTNSFKETAFIYLKEIPSKWNEYKIIFSEFKAISDWSEMSNLSFIVEEWNTAEKKDVVYIEDVKVLQ